MVRQIGGSIAEISIFAGGKITRLFLGYRSHVVKLAGFLRDRITGLTELLVNHVLDRAQLEGEVSSELDQSRVRVGANSCNPSEVLATKTARGVGKVCVIENIEEVNAQF